MFAWLRQIFRRQPRFFHDSDVRPDGSVVETYILPWDEVTHSGIGSSHPLRHGYYVSATSASTCGPPEYDTAKVEVTYRKIAGDNDPDQYDY